MVVGYDPKKSALAMIEYGMQKLEKAEKARDAALHEIGYWTADVKYWSNELAKLSTEEALDKLDEEFMQGK